MLQVTPAKTPLETPRLGDLPIGGPSRHSAASPSTSGGDLRPRLQAVASAGPMTHQDRDAPVRVAPPTGGHDQPGSEPPRTTGRRAARGPRGGLDLGASANGPSRGTSPPPGRGPKGDARALATIASAAPPPRPPRPVDFLSPDEACHQLGSDPITGLTAEDAAGRLQTHGANRLAQAPRTPAWRMLLAQFEDFMVLVLTGAAAVSFFLGEHADALAVVAIVAVNATLGFLQERRAEQSLEALRRLTAPAAHVVRDGRARTVSAEEVVPGDVLLLEAGDRVAADARLLETSSLAVEESALTGESRPVAKDREALSPALASNAEVPPQDRRNMVFQGSHIVRGRGRAVVSASGMSTEVGRIAGLILGAVEGQTPLQRRLDTLGRWLVLGCLGISAAVVFAGVVQGEAPYRMFLAGVSLAVAAIPEGLPAIVTIALALGVQRMIAKSAIVRHLPAVETLGCATVICSDKTGTLTQNVMAVQEVFAGGMLYRVSPDHVSKMEPQAGHPGVPPFPSTGGGAGMSTAIPVPSLTPDRALARSVDCAVLCNNASPDRGSTGADPTEVALLDLAIAAGRSPEALRQEQPRLLEVPFDSERRRMSVAVDAPDGPHAYVKGALEAVLPLCAWVLSPNGRQPLDARHNARIRQEGERMAGSALRVLALAERTLPHVDEATNPEDLERDLCLVGLVGMWDAPRPEVPAAIRRCHMAGVRAVMITGDHALTARAIARQIGLLTPKGRVVAGPELAAMSARELAASVEDVDVFARVSPADKLRIVRALRSRGHVVAMTGDGVNDAPAVKEAHIGIAMGRSGTDVTREASALVLTDDNFATIVAAIEEGRAIYDNIRKFIRYLLACNTGEVLVMLAGTLLGLPLPLLPLQLLLVNLVTDGLPALALGLDPPAPDVMRRPPRDPKESVFAGGLGKRIAVRGVVIGALSLLAFQAVYLRLGDLSAARTAATCTLVFSQLLHAFDARAERRTLWEVGFGGNRPLLLATISSLAILLAMVYLPGPRALFRFTPPDPGTWAVVAVAAVGGAALSGLGEALRRAWARRTSVVRVRRA